MAAPQALAHRAIPAASGSRSDVQVTVIRWQGDDAGRRLSRGDSTTSAAGGFRAPGNARWCIEEQRGAARPASPRLLKRSFRAPGAPSGRVIPSIAGCWPVPVQAPALGSLERIRHRGPGHLALCLRPSAGERVPSAERDRDRHPHRHRMRRTAKGRGRFGDTAGEPLRAGSVGTIAGSPRGGQAPAKSRAVKTRKSSEKTSILPARSPRWTVGRLAAPPAPREIRPRS
jgi:hypothetical protein